MNSDQNNGLKQDQKRPQLDQTHPESAVTNVDVRFTTTKNWYTLGVVLVQLRAFLVLPEAVFGIKYRYLSDFDSLSQFRGR